MAIINRTLDASEQRKILSCSVNGSSGIAIITGSTAVLGIVPWPCTLDAGQIVAFGVSNAPTCALSVNRFIPGSGQTTYVIATGTSNLPPAFGTSGVGISGMILPASGSTLLNLLANDVLQLTFAGTNAAATFLNVTLVLKPIQDQKVNFGII
jgi:hypothetical protein